MEIQNGKVYNHFKGGNVLVLFVAKHSDRDEELVVYRGLNNGKLYARPIESFCQEVENENGEIVSRFSVSSNEMSDDVLSFDEKKIIDEFENYLNNENNLIK